ncbi:hypothetical protein BJX99DRAFT_248649 [Aspergillus californicus]
MACCVGRKTPSVPQGTFYFTTNHTVRVTPTKKACDGCKIRKVRCGGGNPCRPCVNARIQCSYNRVQQSRGPQKLRPTTRYLIERTQRNESPEIDTSSRSASTQERCSSPLNPRTGIPISAIVSLLYIYHVRMYPVWPIVHVDGLIATIQCDQQRKNNEMRALATAVAAATMAQLRLGEEEGYVAADTFVTECLEARRSFDYRSVVNLDTVRTAFFLHVFYENRRPGGSESLLYLREAITLAQMMYLHREASYAGLTMEEQQIRRRVLWLLFVTERGVCTLHKLPVVLKTDTVMPEIDADDQPRVLPAFVKLLALFKLFEQSRMFDIVEDYHLGLKPPITGANTADATFYDILQDKFRDGPSALDHISDVQRADLCVTRQWMRILTWKALSDHMMRGSHVSRGSLSPAFPLTVARDLVNVVSRLPQAALQAHGLGIQLKLHEIANSLADAVINMALLPEGRTWDVESRPSSILARLHSILAAFRDEGNNALVKILYQKMAHAHSLSSAAISPSLGAVTFDDTNDSPLAAGQGIEATNFPGATMQGLPQTGSDQHVAHGKPMYEPADFIHSTLLDCTLEYSLGYRQPTHEPSIHDSLPYLDVSTEALTFPHTSDPFVPFGIDPVDAVLQNFIFGSPQNPLSLETYPQVSDASPDYHSARVNLLA